jgi:GT2 family glycosyltransferase
MKEEVIMNIEVLTTDTTQKEFVTDPYMEAVRLLEFLVSIASQLPSSIRGEKLDFSRSHLKIISIGLIRLKPLCQDQKITEIPVSYLAMYENTRWTVDKLLELLDTDSLKEAEDLTEFQLIPFLKEWREDTYFWLTIYPDKIKMKHYYENEFIENHKNTYENRGEKYLVSIFIPVYNKVEYTKKCLESLFRNTDLKSHSCELILLNDGSTDGTEDYFKELGIRKVLNLKHNVKAMIFSLMYRVCEGKYVAFVNNDTILTSNWLDNLLACIQSDPDIISVSPSTPNTSNLQGMIDEFTPENAEEKALAHNVKCPYLWEERCRLMPVIALYDADKVNTIGFADRYFYTMEFWDDDFCLRARRAGYKQVLCKDTWCYHFGSVSGKEDQLKYRTLQNGRNLFIEKHGVDPWGNNFCYDTYLLTHLETSFKDLPENTPILGIDSGYGADVIQLMTGLRRLGKNVSFSFAIGDANLADDLKPLKGQVSIADSPYSMHRALPEGKFQFICIGKELSLYPDYSELLKECASRLDAGGVLSFYLSNPYSHILKKELEEERLLYGKHSVTLIPLEEPVRILKDQGLVPSGNGILEPIMPADLKINRTEHLNRYLILATKPK